MRAWIFVAGMAVSGCFNPDLEEGFPCSGDSTCPPGFECCSDDTCNHSCCDASSACQGAAWQTCDCTCLSCTEDLVCQAAELLEEDLSVEDCEMVAYTDCSDLSWTAFGNNNTCSDAFDSYCDDGGPDSDTSVCDYGSDCGDCGLR